MSPDGTGDGVERGGGLEAGHCPAQPLVLHRVAEDAALHVENHGKGVGDGPLTGRVVLPHLDIIVEDLESAQVPAPTLLRVAHQALVAHGVEGSVPCSNSDHGVSSSLASGPANLQD